MIGDLVAIEVELRVVRVPDTRQVSDALLTK
jgi:hypothetical protein